MLNLIEDNLLYYWPLKNNLTDAIHGVGLQKYGTGNCRLIEDALYLDGNVGLKMPMNYKFSTKFTIHMSFKDIINTGSHDGIIGSGIGQSGVGSAYMGAMLINGIIHIMNGLGDLNTKTFQKKDGVWQDLVMRYDGINLDTFLDGKLIASTVGCSLKDYPLTICGIYNSPINAAGANFNFTKGYIKDVALYDIPLTDHEILSMSKDTIVNKLLLLDGNKLKSSDLELLSEDYLSIEDNDLKQLFLTKGSNDNIKFNNNFKSQVENPDALKLLVLNIDLLK